MMYVGRFSCALICGNCCIFISTLGPKGEHILGVDDEGILKPVSRLLDKDEAARNEQINKGGPKPGTN